MKLTAIAHRASEEMLKAQAITMNVLWDMQEVDRRFPSSDNLNLTYNRVARENPRFKLLSVRITRDIVSYAKRETGTSGTI